MTITDVKIRKRFDTEHLRAIVSVTFDDCLALHDIKIIKADNREIVVMPARKTGDGRFKDIVHPTNAVLRGELERAIFEEYRKPVSDEAEENSET